MYSPKQYMPNFLEHLISINDGINRICDLIFLMGIKGGWEKWLQLEFANYLRKKYNDTATEVTIRDVNDKNLGRADIEIALRYHQGNTPEKMLIELKCQTSEQNYFDLANGFKSDILKLQKCESPYKFAIAFMHYSSAIYNQYTYFHNYGYYLNDVIDNGVSLSNVLHTVGINTRSEYISLQGLSFEKTASNAPYSSYKGIAALCYSV